MIFVHSTVTSGSYFVDGEALAQGVGHIVARSDALCPPRGDPSFPRTSRRRNVSKSGAFGCAKFNTHGWMRETTPGANAPPLLIQEGRFNDSPPQMRRGGALSDGVV